MELREVHLDERMVGSRVVVAAYESFGPFVGLTAKYERVIAWIGCKSVNLERVELMPCLTVGASN